MYSVSLFSQASLSDEFLFPRVFTAFSLVSDFSGFLWLMDFRQLHVMFVFFWLHICEWSFGTVSKDFLVFKLNLAFSEFLCIWSFVENNFVWLTLHSQISHTGRKERRQFSLQSHNTMLRMVSAFYSSHDDANCRSVKSTAHWLCCVLSLIHVCSKIRAQVIRLSVDHAAYTVTALRLSVL